MLRKAFCGFDAHVAKSDQSLRGLRPPNPRGFFDRLSAGPGAYAPGPALLFGRPGGPQGRLAAKRRRPPPKGRKKPGPTLNGGRRYRLGERGVQGLAFPGAKPGPMAYGGRLYPSAAGYRPRATPAAVARISPPAQGLVMPGSSSGGRSGAGRFPGYAPARPGSGAGRNPGRRAASRCLRR